MVHHHEQYHQQRYEGSRVASNAMLQRISAAAESASAGHAAGPMISGSGSGIDGASTAEMIATHLATALGALVQQTVLLSDPQRTASAHIQQVQQQEVQRDETQVAITSRIPISQSSADSKNKEISTQNDDDDEEMEEIKADDDDDADDKGKGDAHINTPLKAPRSEAVLTAVLRDVEASRRFMQSMRQFDLTSEGSLSLASSQSDISHIHNPNQFSWNHFSSSQWDRDGVTGGEFRKVA